eukprot:1913287-Lingulodinium_polyedra.AAC.1
MVPAAIAAVTGPGTQVPAVYGCAPGDSDRARRADRRQGAAAHVLEWYPGPMGSHSGQQAAGREAEVPSDAVRPVGLPGGAAALREHGGGAQPPQPRAHATAGAVPEGALFDGRGPGQEAKGRKTRQGSSG